MANKKIFWLLIILLILIIIIFFINQLGQSFKLKESENLKKFFATLDQQTPVFKKDSPWQGNQQAKLVIFEFSDWQCPFCAQMKDVLKEVMKNYQDKILLVWKDYPLHSQSQLAAMAARCANEQNQFWPYHDLLFQNFSQLNDNYYLQAATNLNLNIDQFQRCLINPEIEKLIDNDLNEGFLLKVDATPYFFIGQTRVSGYIDYQQFSDLIEQELKR